MRAKHAIRENERRRPHSRYANSFSTQICNRIDVAVLRRLDSQTAAVNSAGEFHIKALFDRLQEIHHQMMRNVETAESEDVFIICPFAFHQTRIEPFFLEKSLLDRGKDGRFASDPDIANPNLV